MSETKIPFIYNGEYGELTLSHPDLEQEVLVDSVRETVDFDELLLALQRRQDE